MRRKISINVTASRTDVDNQFKGTVTFKNEEGDMVTFTYLCIDPKSKTINIKYSGKNDEFHINGIPSNETIDRLKESHKLVFILSIDLLSRTLENTENLLPSTYVNRIALMHGADVWGQMSTECEIEEEGYMIIFKEEISENKKLSAETLISPRLIKKAKYSNLPNWGDCTLEEAEDEYIKAPDEGTEPGDKTLLRILKKIIDLRLSVTA